MTALTPPIHRAPEPGRWLAAVIPLSPRPTDPTRAAEILDRRVGAGWEHVPASAGRDALRAEGLLRDLPARLDPGTPASEAVVTAHRLVATATITLDLLAIELACLSEALLIDLEEIDLESIDALTAAILELSEAPSPSPSWGRPAAAEGAEVVLGLISAPLREARAAHDRLYERFTDHVWEIPAPLLTAGRRRWRCVARARLHLYLRRASRTGARPGPINALAKEIVEVRAIRARLASLRPLLAEHLGGLDRGVFTDVDGAAAAVAAVRRLQRSVATVLDEDRLEYLLLADAFRSHELLGPARSIRTTLAAWDRDVIEAGGSGALGLSADALSEWTADVEQHLAAVEDGVDALARLGSTRSSLQEVVDALLLREHVADHAGDIDRSDQVQPVHPAPRPHLITSDNRRSVS